MDQVGAVLSAWALSPLGVPFVGLVAVVLAAWVGTREAARINAVAQKEISRINTDSAQEIARINTENAQKVERIKAEGQRDLEREKFNPRMAPRKGQAIVGQTGSVAGSET